MAGKASPPSIRELARRRLERQANVSTEEWAKAVEEAQRRGFRLVRLPGLIIEIRDYSLVDT